MEVNEDDSPRGSFEISISEETIKSEQLTLDSTPPSAYPAHTAGQDDDHSSFIQQEPNHTTEEHLINEVRGIYKGMVMMKCIEIDRQQAESEAELSQSQWQVLISLHRTLLYERHDFLLSSQRPSEVPVLKRFAGKKKELLACLRYGIYSFFGLPQQKLPEHVDYMLDFISLSYLIITLLVEGVWTFWRTWIQCVGDLGQYRMDVEDIDHHRLHPPDRPYMLQESESKSALSNNHEVRIFEIPCQLAEHYTNAVGDYGAKANFMKEEYAVSLGLPISQNATCKVTIGSGKQVTTVGTATVPFRFSGDNEVHHLEFQLLPNCIHNVIIGKPFLKFTKTFSNVANFHRRVKERVTKGISQFHLLYLGASTPMFEGSINGQVKTTALADSGSKVLLMDEAYARNIGVHIETGHEHQTRLKFADNSVTDTTGMAYDVKWRFGCDGEFTSPYPLNFHILKNAPANVILSDTFLFDTKAFSQYHHYLIDDDDDCEDEDMLIYFFAIDIDKRKNRTQVNVTSFSLADLRHLELVRRGEEADRISALPGPEGTAAQGLEDERCAEWDRAFTALQANDQPQNLQPLFAAVAAVQSTTSSHSSTSRLQWSGPSQAHRNFLKFSTWLRRENSAGRDGGAVTRG
ncbi:unnamed protein product [Penicillium glandicola]